MSGRLLTIHHREIYSCKKKVSKEIFLCISKYVETNNWNLGKPLIGLLTKLSKAAVTHHLHTACY